MKKIMLLFVFVTLLLSACGQPPKPAVVTLTYEDYAQVELVTPTGRHIFLDHADPTAFIAQPFTAEPTANDILLTTHSHQDHYSKSFVDAFPGQKLTFQTGKIELPDVTVSGIASAHNEGDPLLESGGTNYIYIIDTGGLRIVTFGDIGQDALTADQLAALDRVDIAIMQFDNGYSNMDSFNKKGFSLMDQVKPRLIIPTHVSSLVMKIAFERWTGYYSASSTMQFTRAALDALPAGTGILPLGSLASAYNAIYHLKAWK
jgi:hypothetical protein